jgi:3-oxoacyl-[acyl-carrier protein] reductase
MSPADRKTYIVTGSASGVGAATSLALAHRGAAVVINYSRSQAEAEEVARQCIEAGGEAIVVQADVAQDADCRKLTAAAVERWGRLDGLVNNAGTTKFASAKKLDGLSAEDFQRLYGVNLIGPYQMIRACAPALRNSRGAVVNVSSTAGTTGNGSSIAYACSKGALNTLTLSLSRALAPEIRVNAVLPGFIETRWLRQGLGEENYRRAEAAWQAQSALGETLTPEDVAATILAVLDATKMTGQLITLDAGKAIGKLP